MRMCYFKCISYYRCFGDRDVLPDEQYYAIFDIFASERSFETEKDWYTWAVT